MSEQKIIDFKAENTGHIAYLKLKKYTYRTECIIDSRSKKKLVSYFFQVPEDEINIAEGFWNSDFLKYKRELDSIHQEIISKKNNTRS